MKFGQKIFFNILFISLLTIALLNCDSSQKTPPYCYQSTVNKLSEKLDGLKVNRELYASGNWDGGDFYINIFFFILKRLDMEPGYALDYVYRRTGMGGMPILYARKKTSKPYKTYEEFMKDRDYSGKMKKIGFIGMVPKNSKNWQPFPVIWDEWLGHIQIDGTPEAFFELAVLKTMGGQFYLWWHANYNDLRVICDRNELDTPYFKRLPDRILKAAKNLNFNPRVSYVGDSVEVTLIVFTRWGGFLQKCFIFNRNFPHRITSENEKILIEYNCGIWF